MKGLFQCPPVCCSIRIRLLICESIFYLLLSSELHCKDTKKNGSCQEFQGDIWGDIFFIVFFSSDYAELSEHSCSTDYARNLNGFGLTAIGLAHSHSSFRGYRHARQVEFPFKLRE